MDVMLRWISLWASITRLINTNEPDVSELARNVFQFAAFLICWWLLTLLDINADDGLYMMYFYYKVASHEIGAIGKWMLYESV